MSRLSRPAAALAAGAALAAFACPLAAQAAAPGSWHWTGVTAVAHASGHGDHNGAGHGHHNGAGHGSRHGEGHRTDPLAAERRATTHAIGLQLGAVQSLRATVSENSTGRWASEDIAALLNALQSDAAAISSDQDAVLDASTRRQLVALRGQALNTRHVAFKSAGMVARAADAVGALADYGTQLSTLGVELDTQQNLANPAADATALDDAATVLAGATDLLESATSARADAVQRAVGLAADATPGTVGKVQAAVSRELGTVSDSLAVLDADVQQLVADLDG